MTAVQKRFTMYIDNYDDDGDGGDYDDYDNHDDYMTMLLVLRISFFVEAVDQPEKEEERRSAIAVVELQVRTVHDSYKLLKYTYMKCGGETEILNELIHDTMRISS